MGKKARVRARGGAAQLIALGWGAMLPLAGAWAQQAPAATPAPTTDASTAALETVTVTAQRRRENIKDVPLSMTSVGGEKLDVLTASGQDIRVLSGRIPSLNIESSTGRVSPRFYIRGYGNTDFSAFASQPVSLIMDDVVQENVILKGVPMFDIENVEVLRGPQGTLFGRNTPAGVVKFESVKPNFDGVSGYYSVSDGTHNTAIAEGGVNLPLSSEWAMRLSAQVQHRDNWVKNTGNSHGNLDGYDERAARLQFLYKPSTSFDALFNLHARGTEGSSRLFRANLLSLGSNDIVPSYSPGTININGQNTQNLHSAGASARLNWQFDGFSLHSITGFEHVSSFMSRGDIDGGTPTGPGFIPFQVETAASVPSLRQFTQELRVQSKIAGPLNWQAGLYYFDENAVSDSYGYDTTSGAQSSLLRGRQTNQATAVFGSVTYEVSDRLKLRGGLRYTRDQKDFTTEIQDHISIVGPGGVSESKSKANWDVSANYALTKDVGTYARIATGYRAPSIAAPSQWSPITVANAESVTSYEAGVKAELFERRARLNVSVYAYDVKDQQLSAVGGASNSIALINAKKTVGRGLEADLEARFAPNFRMSFGGSYNFTQIQDPNLYTAGCGSCTMLDRKNAAGFYLIDGNALPQAPKWVANVTARYSIPLANYDEVFFYTDWSYRSKINLFLYDSVEFTGKALLDGGARVGYKWDGGKYELAAFVRNILDKQVVTGAIDFNNRTGFTNEPRLFGVQLRANF